MRRLERRLRPNRRERLHNCFDVALLQAGDIHAPVGDQVDSVIVPEARNLVTAQAGVVDES
jgi:hypothetical protein